MILLPCSDRFNARYLISYADISIPRTSPPLLLQEFSRKRVVAQPCWASFGPRRPMHHYAAQAIGLPPVEKISARLFERAHSRRNFRAFSLWRNSAAIGQTKKEAPSVLSLSGATVPSAAVELPPLRTGGRGNCSPHLIVHRSQREPMNRRELSVPLLQ